MSELGDGHGYRIRDGEQRRLGAPGEETGPCKPGIGGPGDVLPCEIVGHPPRPPKHLVVEHSARHSGSQSRAERISPRSSRQRMSRPHASPSSVPNRHELSPSTPRTTRPGSTKVEPTPDERRSCEHPKPSPLFCHGQRKNPGHYDETPGPIASGRPDGGTPHPAPDDSKS